MRRNKLRSHLRKLKGDGFRKLVLELHVRMASSQTFSASLRLRRGCLELLKEHTAHEEQLDISSVKAEAIRLLRPRPGAFISRH